MTDKYQKFIQEFGAKPISPILLDRLAAVTKLPVHVFLRRSLVFAHRDFEDLLKRYEKGEQFYIYSGRGPSSGSLHIGHMIQFLFIAYLQKAFKVPVVIQITDDEKHFTRGITLEECKENAKGNIADIMACGLDLDNTFVFTNTEYMGTLYPNVVKIQAKLNNSQVKNTFGITGEDNVGRVAFPAVQMAPCFSSSFPHLFDPKKPVRCLVPCGMDQDPFFRLLRDVASPLGELKPTMLYTKFVPSLLGLDQFKMSASIPNSAIYVSDTDKQIKKKINKSFSGGRETLEEHRRLGAVVEKDVSIHYLGIFCEDDEELNSITEKYRKGELMSGEVKAKLIGVIQKLIGDHRELRKLKSG